MKFLGYIFRKLYQKHGKKFPLENLPIIVLFEIFLFIEPEELFDVRFLNKYLFSIIGVVIKEYLQHSTYYKSQSFMNIQNKFIKYNSTTIKHLQLDLFKVYTNSISTNIINITQNNKFRNIKSLHLNFDTINLNNFNQGDFNNIKEILNRVEKVELSIGEDEILDPFFLILNPKALKALCISRLYRSLTINNILNFKKFENLEELKFCAFSLVIESKGLVNSDTVIFPSLKKLDIEVVDFIIDFDIFNNNNQLKSITTGFPKYNTSVLNFINNVSPLTKLLLDYPSNQYFTDLTLFFRQIYPLVEVNNVALRFIRTSFLYPKDYNEDIPKFNYVEELIFDYCKIVISFLSNMLKYFPNVKKIKIKNSSIYNDTNDILTLPNDSNSFLLCIDKSSLKDPSGTFPFNGINTYVY